MVLPEEANKTGSASQPNSGAASPSGSQSDGNETPQDEGRGGEVSLENLQQVKQKAPELVPMAESLEKDYRKKMEKISNIRNQAEAYKEIIKDPKFQKYYSEAYGGNSGVSNNSANASGAPKSVLDELDLDDDMMDESTKKIAQVAKQQASEIKQLKDMVAKQKNEVMLEKLEEEYPDIRQKLGTLVPLINQGYSLKSAYLEKYGDEYYKRKLEREKKNLLSKQEKEKKEKKAGNLPPNVSGGGSGNPPAEQNSNSITGAIERAFDNIATS